MKGLLLKDFYITKANLLAAFLSCAVIAAGMSVIVSPSVVIILTAIPLSMTTSGTIISDKKNRWSQFAVTLPVSKKQIVASKYIAYLFWMILGLAAGYGICCLILYASGKTDPNITTFIGFSVIISLLSGSITIPCNFLLPEEKSIIGTILAYTLTSGLLTLAVFGLNRILDVRQHLTQILLAGSAVSLAVFLISYLAAAEKIRNFD